MKLYNFFIVASYLSLVVAEDREAFLCHNLLKFINDEQTMSVKYELLHDESEAGLKLTQQHPFNGKETFNVQFKMKNLLNELNKNTVGRGHKKWDLAERLLREALTSRLGDKLPEKSVLREVHSVYDAIVTQYYDLQEITTSHSSWVLRTVFQKWVDVRTNTLRAKLEALYGPLAAACGQSSRTDL